MIRELIIMTTNYKTEENFFNQPLIKKKQRMNFEREQKLAIAVPGYVEYIFNM